MPDPKTDFPVAPVTLVWRETLIRPVRLSDAQGSWQEWMRDPAVASNLAVPHESDAATLVAYIERSKPPGAYLFAICNRASGEHIGNCRLGSIDSYNRKASQGWLIGNAAERGRGHGMSALALLLHFAFEHLGLNRLSSATRTSNAAALAVHKKCGFSREGQLRDYLINAQGRYEDVIQFSILRDEYRAMDRSIEIARLNNHSAPESERP